MYSLQTDVSLAMFEKTTLSAHMDFEELYLLDSTYLIRRRMLAGKKRSCWVNRIYQKRTMGEYKHLHMDFENEPPKFFFFTAIG